MHTNFGIVSFAAISVLFSGGAHAQDNRHQHPGQHAAEVVAHDEFKDQLHEAYLNYEGALVELCQLSVMAMHDHASTHHGSVQESTHDVNMAIANCVNSHLGDHNDVIQEIHTAIHDELHAIDDSQ
ncbi:hypothetical protein [uncultured Ruegeria sp.]|uniref:hypothetical protein n=1 Tax=uncultured Ruegeria sp. TaxID=259304 RepID=UPI00260F378A|nr:hypothetical protein [uncultured Ruegeria sp.]